jgi:phospholipase C
MPGQERGTRPHRPTSIRPFADVTVNRTTSQVTATLSNTGQVGVSFAIYPDGLLPATPTPVTVLRSAPGSYTWDAALTGAKYAFSVYGPDGFLADRPVRLLRRRDHRQHPDGFRRRSGGRIA